MFTIGSRYARSISVSLATSLALLALAAPASALAAAPRLKLEKSVLFMRHGLRSPNQSTAELAPSSTRPWPEWSVKPGELTPHGAALVSTLGGYFRQRYAADGLLPAEGCPEAGAVANWADNAAARIPLSAQALMDGMFPGCGLKMAFAPQTGIDPLFNPVGAGACPLSAPKARAAVLNAAHGDLDRAAHGERSALQRLQAILQVRLPGRACSSDVPSCELDGLASVLVDGKEGPALEGPIKLAATISENFLFEYLEGMPEKDVAWGDAATPEALAAVIGPRNLYLRLLRKPPYLAARHTTALARAMLAALDSDAATSSPNANKLVAFVGRDQHLAGLAGLLGLNWSLPGMPDENAPGATLAFERLRNPADGKQYVRARLYYLTLTQMREGSALDLAHPPGQVLVKFPGCDKEAIDGACPIATVRARFQAGFAEDCPVAPPA